MILTTVPNVERKLGVELVVNSKEYSESHENIKHDGLLLILRTDLKFNLIDYV